MSLETGLLSGLMLCSHCRKTMKVRLSSDIGVVIHWVDDGVLFDVFLLLSDGSGVRIPFLLYREVYALG